MTEKLNNEVKSFNPLRTLIIVVLVIAAAYIIALTMIPAEKLEAEDGNLGAWSCVPAVFLVVYIFATKRVLEGLILGSVVGLIFAAPGSNVIGSLSSTATDVMMDEDTGWLIIVCGLMGSIIKLIAVSYTHLDVYKRQTSGFVRAYATAPVRRSTSSWVKPLAIS